MSSTTQPTSLDHPTWWKDAMFVLTNKDFKQHTPESQMTHLAHHSNIYIYNDNGQSTSNINFHAGVIHFHHCPGLSGPGSSSPPPDTWRSWRSWRSGSSKGIIEPQPELLQRWAHGTSHGTSISIAILPSFWRKFSRFEEANIGELHSEGTILPANQG